MPRKIISIAILQIRLVMAESSSIIFWFIMPILFTALMSYADFTSRGPGGQHLGVVNEDSGQLGQKAVDALQKEGMWKVALRGREAALEKVRTGKAIAALIIPADFSERALGGGEVAFELRANLNSAKDAQLARLTVEAMAARVNASIEAARESVRTAEGVGALAAETGDGAATAARRAYFAESVVRAFERLETNPLIAVEERRDITSSKLQGITPSNANQSSPGMLVMFALFFIIAGTNMLIYERQLGTLRRLLVMPMSRTTLMLGKFVGIYVLGVLQMFLLILVGAYLFGVNWGQSPAGLVVMVLSLGFVNTGLGILLAAKVRTIQQANAIASMVVMTLSALGGAWWPLEIVPRWMQRIGGLLPTAWAMDGFHDIIIRGQGVVAVLPEASILLVAAVIFLAIGIWRFSYE